MKQAVWNDVVLAQSDNTVVVEGNHYFPPESLNKEHFSESDTHTTCPWKGLASYYDVTVNGKTNSDAGWFYKNPSLLAKKIKGHVAFWNGVQVEDVNK